jgi:hypothetical protein
MMESTLAVDPNVMIKKQRLPFIFLAILSLVGGLVAGMIRIGWNLSIPNLSAHHGAIMVGGFIGTLISLEKVIALKIRYLYVVPFTSGASTVLFLFGFPVIAFSLLVAASFGLVVVVSVFLWKERTLVYAIMLAGAACWLVGNIMLGLTRFYPSAFGWWICFALLTIASERLELMKFLPVSSRSILFFFFLLIAVVVGCLFSFHGIGTAITGLGLAGVALWLMRHDVVGISIKKNGLTKYVAFTLITGYMWLLLTGIFLMTTSGGAFSYDLIVHCFFIGFVLSMIFAHGPIILPGVIGISIKPFSNAMYVCLGLLHLSLALRIVGDVFVLLELRKYSGVVTALALVSYFGTLLYLILTNGRNVRLL